MRPSHQDKPLNTNIMVKRITKAEATAMAKFFISKKYPGKISNFSVYTEAGGSKATARFKLDNISWAQHFVVEVIMDLFSGTIESREYRHSDNLSFYRNPDLQ